MTTTRAQTQLERLTFFSDAVFAIAMTLLVVEVKLPHLEVFGEAELANALLSLIPDYVGFLVSFLVLGRFWAGHHTLMGWLVAASPRLVWANLLLLLAVAFMPFPTAVVSSYAGLRVGIGFYAGWLLLLGLLNRHLIQVVARDPSLAAPGADPRIFHEYLTRSWIPVCIALAAFGLAMVTPMAGLAALIVGSPLISIALQRRAARLRRG